MSRVRDKRGFTLIELAIVLVIIGIILGAVIKGQDLIDSAKHKKFISKVRHWETAQWAFFDRYGRFAGDGNKNGKIGGTGSSVVNDLKRLANPPYEDSGGSPVNTITLGSQTFYVYFGTDNGDDNGKNIMVICATSACGGAFDDVALEFLKALDTAIDGVEDGKAGQVRGTDSQPNMGSASAWIVYFTSPLNIVAWTSSPTAAVYWFDSPKKD